MKSRKNGEPRMKKFFASPLARRLPVCLGLVALAAALGFTCTGFVDSNEVWMRFVYLLAVAGTGIAGIIYLLAGWVGILIGYGFVLVITLPAALSEPVNRYFVVLELLAMFAVPAARIYARKRRKSGRSESEEGEEADDIDPEEVDAARADAEGAPVFVCRLPLGRAYQVFLEKEEFLFYRVGRSWMELDMGRIHLGGVLPPPGKKDIVIPARSITNVRFRDVDNDNAPYDVLAVLRADGRRYRFAPLFNPGGESLFALLQAGAPPDAFRRAETREPFAPTPNKRRLVWVKRAFYALCALALLVDLAWVFLAVPYAPFAWLSIAFVPALLLLYFLFPGETTVSEAKRRANGRAMLAFPLLMTAIVPLLRLLLDFNILAWGRLLLYAAVSFAPLVAIMLLLSPECRAAKRLLLAPALALAIWLVGSVGMANALCDAAPPAEFSAAVQELEITHGTKSPDRYMLTARTEDGRVYELSIAENVYNTLSAGGKAIVYVWNGALGIPYADADAVD